MYNFYLLKWFSVFLSFFVSFFLSFFVLSNKKKLSKNGVYKKSKKQWFKKFDDKEIRTKIYLKQKRTQQNKVTYKIERHNEKIIVIKEK